MLVVFSTADESPNGLNRVSKRALKTPLEETEP
jgi:hypothetical protein